MDISKFFQYVKHTVLILVIWMKNVHTARITCASFVKNQAFENLILNASAFRIQIRNENNPPVCVHLCFEFGYECAGVLVNEALYQCWFLKCFLTERYLQRGLLTVSSGWKYYSLDNKCRPDWVPYNGHCYLSVNSVKDTWFGSMSRCNRLGSYLVEIGDEEENMWLISTFPLELNGQYFYEKAIMIGASGVVETGPYTWNHSGLPLVYQPWYPGEPNAGSSERCATLMSNGYWNNIPCQIQRPFVCETD